MPKPNAEDTDRIDQDEVRKAAEEEAERVAFDLAGKTSERRCLTGDELTRSQKPPE